ncbi:YbhB/YbcL family Raf kinase inhibitor-like protein [uncultured Cohaesibacter sp.]|uniref:YbhB/YbcL family Raf kinase inhibitor-like protein n=1 Tax=uncultured Cohaesibacter sp. TaxID=1002546 RepID=UPI0029316790|nr:YbhB/YbcL family Raf kinase inhibitor-like protein [uncultured Cohaesibacter sp.]
MLLTSPDFKDGDPLPSKSVSKRLGGEDLCPILRWSGVPADAKSLALTCYDPDAPTGSGFWHMIITNIPVSESGEISCQTLPESAKSALNDAGTESYIGACPPADDPAHRYIFTLHALSLEEIEPSGITGAYVRFNIMRNQIASASITGHFKNNG